MISEQDWQRLEADRHAGGASVRRLYPRAPHDIFIAVRHQDGARMLTLGITGRAAPQALRQLHSLPRTHGIEMQFARKADGNSELRVVLSDSNLREVFTPLASDIAATAQAEPGPGEAVLAAISRFEHWRRMLRALADTGLSPEARRGLYGELIILRDQLLPTLPGTDAVRAWAGPAGASHDFQLSRAAIEVKTSAGKEPQVLVISSERQLDSKGVPRLILAHLSLDERRGGSGESLNTAADRVRDAAGAAAEILLDDLLVRAGYLRQHRDLYDEPRYTIRRQRFWDVTGDFPRITEDDLRPGVGDCRYSISAAGLDRYLLGTEDLTGAISGRQAHE